MGQVLHGSATTTEAIRRAIQNSEESLRALSKRLWDQPEDGGQMEEAGIVGRPADRAERTALDDTFNGGGSRYCRLPQAHVAAS